MGILINLDINFLKKGKENWFTKIENPCKSFNFNENKNSDKEYITKCIQTLAVDLEQRMKKKNCINFSYHFFI